MIRFVGIPYQRGNGFFTSFLHKVIPFVKKKILPHVFKQGTALAKDIMTGQDIKTATKRRLSNVGKQIVSKAAKKIYQSGKGIKPKKVLGKAHLIKSRKKQKKVRKKKPKKKQKGNKVRKVDFADVFN